MFDQELIDLEAVYRKALFELDLEEEEIKPSLYIVMEEMVDINERRNLINEKLERLLIKKEEALSE